MVMTYTIGSSWMCFCFTDYPVVGAKSKRREQQFFSPLKTGETLVWDDVRAPLHAASIRHLPRTGPCTARVLTTH